MAETNKDNKLVQKGEPLSKIPALSVDECIGKGTDLNGKTVKIAGVVKSVCQQKGCWFVLEGKKSEDIRITSMGYKFMVPTNSTGRNAIVEGKFELKTLDVARAQHLEDDRVIGTSEKPAKITAPVKEYTLAATGVEFK
jgi:hypothetical protein